jgi:16S rRNA (cytidine1402-2'-O)-methyltransferase
VRVGLLLKYYQMHQREELTFVQHVTHFLQVKRKFLMLLVELINSTKNTKSKNNLLSLVPTPIGNLQDISFRAIEALKDATVILCEDTRVTKKLLTLLSQNFDIEFHQDQKEFLSFHHHNGDKFLRNITPEFFDKSVVYVSDAGMPCVSDPGSLLVEYMIANDLSYDVLPGANALLTAYAMSGFDEKEFTFFAFLPHKGEDRKKELQRVCNSNTLSILYESPHRIEKLADELADMIPNREVFLVKELTKTFQTYIKTTANNLPQKMKETNTKGEWVVIVDKDTTIANTSAITVDDIKSLDISLKQKSKLIAKIIDMKPKECYNMLLKEDDETI